MDLFKENMAKHQPLAKRCAPQDFSEFIGQEHIVGPGRLLRRAIEADKLSSLIFAGPPGTGKTALANLIANYSKAAFIQLNAVNSKVADLREVVEKAKERLAFNSQRTILFIDEIHRFNKAQQDALLPDVEAGVIILIGATTENPYFGVNPALISRSQVFEFKPLERKDLSLIIEQALKKEAQPIVLDEEARQHLLAMAGGDARKVLSALELAIMTTPAQDDGQIHITVAIAEESIQKKKLVYDESEHYDVISAFIKSMRGSDPDAALYWLAKMIYAGEDPRFIARRIVICASEDVGNADPLALVVANACLTTVAEIGYPEARITLAQTAVYVATAPKSNASYVGIDQALADVGNGLDVPVPPYLKSNGTGYKYAHDYPKAHVDQIYLPNKKKYYMPTDRGYEKKIAEWLKWLNS